MSGTLSYRATHYAFLTAVAAGLFLVNLGGPSLWDIDEGNNAEAAREMLASGDWVVPTFNFQLRVDKPALLYWLQVGAYRLFGVGEFAARLPSALAGWLAVLLAYELGRRLYGRAAGLLGALVLAGAAMFCAASHFANPDALLCACTLLTLTVFWTGFARGSRNWFAPAGVCAGLAVLAKGPIGVILPAAVIGLFLLCSRRIRVLCDRRLLLGALAFVLVAAPWYILVGTETHGEYFEGFFFKHNVSRFLAPMEGHRGPVFYYLFALPLGFAPWSGFLLMGLWYCRPWAREAHGEGKTQAAGDRFLWCWIAVYVAFFSLSATKLPNYVLPAYPAAALLTGRFLDRWRRGVLHPPSWAVRLCLAFAVVLGIATATGALLAGSGLRGPGFRVRGIPGLEQYALVGLPTILGGCAAWWYYRRANLQGLLFSFSAGALLFIGLLAGWGSAALENQKAPRALLAVVHQQLRERDYRVGCFDYFQPSLVFYSGREVRQLRTEEEALDFLKNPLPAYLLMPAGLWEELKSKAMATCRRLGERRDLYRRKDVVVVTNR